jgi:membrane-bound lytic murein transglycosylase
MDGMKTHYQTNPHDMEDLYKKDYKDQMKNRDFRQNLSKTMKNDMGLSKFDRFDLQMYRLSFYTNPFNINFKRPDPILQLNITVDPEPQVPIITLPPNFEIWLNQH